MGRIWRHNHFAQLKQRDDNFLDIDLPGGGQRVFVRNTFPSQGPWRPTNGFDVLTQTANGWTLHLLADDSVLAFNTTGVLQTVTQRNGWVYTYAHDAAGKVTQVSNQFGRTLGFQYNASNQLTSVTASIGTVGYSYDSSGRLVTVTYPDSTQRSYHYEHTSIPDLVTGISIQGTRYATIGYDIRGFATSTALAGNVNAYSVAYSDMTPGRYAAVTDPLGNTRNFGYSSVRGVLAVTSGSLSLTGAPDAYSRVQNSLGLIDSETDFKGVNTTYEWDAARRLRLSSTDAAGRSETRTTTTTWHPQWRLPVAVTEQGRVTSYTYDSVGNVLSHTITDSGTSGSSRTTNWTYYPTGLVATETAPNGAVTSYQYDSAGNLTSAINAQGHVDTYTRDAAGRVLTHTTPTGVTITYTYDARGRMLTASADGQVTALTYSSSGKVATATLPHGHLVTYQYDAAQRLTGWTDNRGASATYVLDGMDNRKSEEVRNAQGQVAWNLARTINSLNRVESVTVGPQAAITYGYDANGDLFRTTNGLGVSTHFGLDALRRVQAIHDSELATATLTYNALDSVTQASDFKGVATTYERDALGNAKTEASPDAGTQSAQYDALGLPSSITDALGRATTIVRDSLGRPTSITHAGGAGGTGGTGVASQTTTLRYDLPGSAYNQSGQPNASKGSLSEIVDASGTTSYQRDWHGRVVRKTQQLKNGHTSTVGYSYAPSGLLASITYPDGKVLQHQYDSTGLLTALTWNNQPLVSGITWNPLGQPTGWTWNLQGSQGSTSLSVARSYNTAGQLTTTDFSSYQYDAAGRINSLTQNLWAPASPNPLEQTVQESPVTWSVQYRSTGQIMGFTRQGASGAAPDTTSYRYDANGNRTASTSERTLAGKPTVTNRNYSVSANRLTGFSQSQQSTDPATGQVSTANTSVAYNYDAAGNQQGDGLHGYQYDSEGRLERVTLGTGAGASSVQYAHNALGLRVFKTDVLASGTSNSTTANNKTGPAQITLLGDDGEEQSATGLQPTGLLKDLQNFWLRLWSPQTDSTQAQGRAFVYAEDGSLLGEYPMEANPATAPTKGAQHIWLPTANGPMPIAVVGEGRQYAVHADHLNTPRRLTQEDGQVAWQWEYSAFGDEAPTTAATRFTSAKTNPTTGSTAVPLVQYNLRYPGQYFDEESGLHYNHFRSYDSKVGRYTQADPIGLEGGWNRFGYVDANPLSYMDSMGLVASADPWFGYGGDKGFRDWWHAQKPYYGGQDIPNKEVCDNLYKDYKESNERGKGGKSGRGGKSRGDKRPTLNELLRNGGRGGYGRGGSEE
ncbi:RHS repeat-associated core domain-containing protein [Acidovorax sp. NPDC077693]|uniref:RHS repeat-associated core domain-containing protein n=1 Tax=unclassified Acidovorax TaxID=2684926 RepID=UPI0037C96BEE